MTDKTPGACQCHEKHAPTYWKGVVREYKAALEKAERERDEALADAESRPLTPDAITDAMIERAREVLVRESWVEPFDPETAGTFDREDHADATRVIIAALTAALTDPPARPEGAEKVEAVLHQYWSGDINGDDLADRIAEEMNR